MKKPFILVSVAAALILLLGTAARLLGYVNTPPQPREPQRFDAVLYMSFRTLRPGFGNTFPITRNT